MTSSSMDETHAKIVKYLPRMRQYARGVLRKTPIFGYEAEDIVNDAIAGILQQHVVLDDRNAWFYIKKRIIIVISKAANYRREHFNQSLERIALGTIVHLEKDTWHRQLDEIERADLMREIANEVATMPPRLQLAFILLLRHNSTKEIGHALRSSKSKDTVSEGSAEVMGTRKVRELVQRLRGRFNSEAPPLKKTDRIIIAKPRARRKRK